MQTFTLTVLAIYSRYPHAAAAKINSVLGVPPQMIRHERNFLGQVGYLEKDENLHWNITETGRMALQFFDRDKAAENAKFLKEASEIAAGALGVDRNELSRFTLMDKGMTNDSYLFTCKGKRYIYRQAGQGSERLVDRHREYSNYMALKGRNISDNVLYHNPVSGTKITEFIEDCESIDINNPQHIELALEALRYLHKADIEPPHEYDFLKTIDYYEELCHSAEAELFSTHRKYKARITALIEKVKKLNPPQCFCHIDFVPGNCLLTKEGRVVLIDWEYSGKQDPIVDVAMFCISAALDKRQSDRLLKKYLQRKPEAEENARFYTYIATAGMMWCLWNIFKTANGEIFEGYTERTYNLCRKYSKLAERVFEKLENTAD